VFNTEAHPLSVLKPSAEQTPSQLIGSLLGKLNKPKPRPEQKNVRTRRQQQYQHQKEYNDKKAMVTVEVVAPGTFPEGHMLGVQIPNGASIHVQVPEGGVKKGDSFIVEVPASDVQQTAGERTTATTKGHNTREIPNQADGVNDNESTVSRYVLASHTPDMNNPAMVRMTSLYDLPSESKIKFQLEDGHGSGHPIFEVQVPQGGVTKGETVLARLPAEYAAEHRVTNTPNGNADGMRMQDGVHIETATIVDRGRKPHLPHKAGQHGNDNGSQKFTRAVAPATLDEGETVYVQLHQGGPKFNVLVPKGGIVKGEYFKVPYPTDIPPLHRQIMAGKTGGRDHDPVDVVGNKQSGTSRNRENQRAKHETKYEKSKR
jgi:hypothetical protein